MTFWIRRWYHIRTAKQFGIEVLDYMEWRELMESWPLKRAIPSYIKNIKWRWRCTMTILEKSCVVMLLVFLALSIIIILVASI